MPHEATEDTIFRGFTVPKGATIFSNLYAVHNDETLVTPKILLLLYFRFCYGWAKLCLSLQTMEESSRVQPGKVLGQWPSGEALFFHAFLYRYELSPSRRASFCHECALKVEFLAGRRVCLGDQLAKAEMFLVITSVLQRFQLASPSAEPKPDASGVLGMSLKPKPHRLIATPRKTSAAGPPNGKGSPVECSEK